MVVSSPCSVVVFGFLGSFLLFHHGWQSLFVVVSVAGLAWALLLRTVSVRSRYDVASFPGPVMLHGLGTRLGTMVQCCLISRPRYFLPHLHML